jgi:DNA-directed RNA polymerase subunit omega
MHTRPTRYWPASFECEKLLSATKEHKNMNAELVRQALEKVINPYVLVNLISRRVRQLNAGGGRMSRPLIANTGNLGAADIVLCEIIEDKMGFEMPEMVKLTRTAGQRRSRPPGWMKLNATTNKPAG